MVAGPPIYRDRRQPVPDPYNPGRNAPGSWDDAQTITLDDAWIASSSSTAVRDAPRSELLTAKSLYCLPDADVKVGDRIRDGSYVGLVRVRPSADTNPFTGWRPVLEVPLEEVSG